MIGAPKLFVKSDVLFDYLWEKLESVEAGFPIGVVASLFDSKSVIFSKSTDVPMLGVMGGRWVVGDTMQQHNRNCSANVLGKPRNLDFCLHPRGKEHLFTLFSRASVRGKFVRFNDGTLTKLKSANRKSPVSLTLTLKKLIPTEKPSL